MARPRRCRRICSEPSYDSFLPGGFPSDEEVILTLDEYEAIRLVDMEKLTHEQCAKQMDISRTTVTEIYESARTKIADCLVNGKQLFISGGQYRVCDGTGFCCHRDCKKPPTSKKPIKRKGAKEMRIAVTYNNGMIFQHFGHTEQFNLYDIQDGKVIGTQLVDTNGQGHGALSDFLVENQVEALICGGIGGGAQSALAAAGIKLYGGVSGVADEAVAAYLAGNLGYNPNVQCNHHGHDHSCGEHKCGEDKHGCGGN